MNKSYKVSTDFGDYTVQVRKAQYWDNKNLAIELFDPEEGPFARLTVNLGKKLPDNQAYVDVNNCPWAERFIEENGLGEHQDKFGISGYCVYPLYEFNMDKVCE